MSSSLPVKFVSLGVILLLAPALVLGSTRISPVSPSNAQSYTSDSVQEASTLLQQLEGQAYQVNHLADQLVILDRDSNFVGWWGEAITLDRTRHQINAMADTVSRLRALSPETLSWQQRAIDVAALRVTELADNTQSAIQYLNHHHDYLYDPNYVADATYMSDWSQNLGQTLHNFNVYGRTRQEQRVLAHELDLKTTS
jgi:hypothetical protein